jgi:hypothetical protein
MGEMSGVVIVMIKIKEDLYIFCERKRKNTKDRIINTDGSLIPVIINKIIFYRNLEEVRLFYGIND